MAVLVWTVLHVITTFMLALLAPHTSKREHWQQTAWFRELVALHGLEAYQRPLTQGTGLSHEQSCELLVCASVA